MKQEWFPGKDKETEPRGEKNPNSIGELLSLGQDLPTTPDKVYRSVSTADAIKDIQVSGIVRNKQSAGLVEKSRWGERVFWSKGSEGKFHPVPQGAYIIEAPLSVAQERVVRSDDITAIYTKNTQGDVINILDQRPEETEEASRVRKQKNTEIEERLRGVRENLGIDTKK